MFCHRTQIGARLESRQRENSRAVGERHGGEIQAVHVVQGRDDQCALDWCPFVELHTVATQGPKLALVAERHALGQAGRSGGVENLREILLAGDVRLERAGIEKLPESSAASLVEGDSGYATRNSRDTL